MDFIILCFTVAWQCLAFMTPLFFLQCSCFRCYLILRGSFISFFCWHHQGKWILHRIFECLMAGILCFVGTIGCVDMESWLMILDMLWDMFIPTILLVLLEKINLVQKYVGSFLFVSLILIQDSHQIIEESLG